MEAIIGILGPIIEVGKCIGGPIKRHFNYLFCFSNNIQSLREEAQKLKDANDGLQIRVDAAKNNIEVIYPEVLTWLGTVSQNLDITNGIENDVPKVQNGCLNLISRYSLSRKAKKTIEALRNLHANYKFDRISEVAPPAAMGPPAVMVPTEDFQSRKEIEEDVMKTLRARNVNIIGLCGMGGVGKTTMAKRIMDRVKEEKLFDEIVMVVVSQQVDKLKLQKSIADQLSLTLDSKDLMARAYKIRTRLTSEMKKSLLVIDDVWESLDLNDLGIPSGNCTVLLTSRDRNVFEVETRIFRIETLPSREAWLLFRKNTGNFVDGEDLRPVAEEVAKECKGLPVALVTVGGALRNMTSRQVWEDALSQLRSSKPDDLPRMLADVYNPLRLSYDYLESEHAKSIFLLCSVFMEDFDIDLETLTRYGVGLDILGEHRNLKEARNRTRALIERLKVRSLLLDGFNEHFVKMHDVVRDMAIYIAAKEHHGGCVINYDAMLTNCARWENYYEDCYWISITNISPKIKFLVELKCPRLCLLTMEGEDTGEQLYDLRLADSFFDGMQEIRVLAMERIQINSLPPSTKLLKNLKTLQLDQCHNLETIGVVGELLKLEIFDCIDCNDIRALPIEIVRLKHLRLLKICNCENLTRIVPGIISKLTNLEELALSSSFRSWEAKESKAKENAALAELESLTKLTCLEIEIDDTSLAAEEICLPSGIAKYNISISTHGYQPPGGFSGIYIEIPKEIKVGNWIKTFVTSAESLGIEGDNTKQLLNFVEYEKKKCLAFRSCSLVNLVNTTTITTGVFPLLECLGLHDLDNLEEIIPVGYCYTDYYSCFRNLKEIDISRCPRLQYLFPMSVAVRCLAQLEVLNVEHCEAIEDIFCDDHDKMEKDGEFSSHNLRKAFPELKQLILDGLPKLKAQETLDKISAPLNLRRLVLERLKDDAISSRSLVCHSFSNLVNLRIGSFNGIKNLMSPAIARNLAQLHYLSVCSCEMMSVVIADEDDDDDGVQVMGQMSLFPSLEILYMTSLPNLKGFCQWKHQITLELPSLRKVQIDNCSLLETFSHGCLNTPRLKTIKLNDRHVDIKDLNKAIQQCRSEQMHGSSTEIEA